MGTTSLWGLTTGNPLTTSSEESIKDYFNNQSGDATTSNMWKIDLGAQGFNTRIIDLENTAKNSFQLYTINLVWDSTVSETDYYTGTSDLITSLEDKMMFLFYFDKTNTGSVTFKINSLDTVALKKVDSTGTLMNMEVGDIKANVPYYVQWHNGQMIFVGENLTQQVKTIQSTLETKPDKVVGATNGNIAGLDTNGNLIDGGRSITSIPTKPIVNSITLLTDNWVEDTTNGYWTQTITDTDIVDGTKVDLSLSIESIKDISTIGSSLMVINNNGTATVYAFNKMPTTDLYGQIELRVVNQT